MINGYLLGDRELVRSMKAFPPELRAEVDRVVQRHGFKVQARAQSAYLRGPRPAHLGVRTGRLINSVVAGRPGSTSRFVSTPTSSLYYIGTNVSYGAAWEKGFTRKVGAGARGGPRTLKTAAALARYVSKHPAGQKNEAARPFLSPALADDRQSFINDLQAVLVGTMRRAVAA